MGVHKKNIEKLKLSKIFGGERDCDDAPAPKPKPKPKPIEEKF
jgi:hypothetical protein